MIVHDVIGVGGALTAAVRDFVVDLSSAGALDPGWNVRNRLIGGKIGNELQL